MQEISRLRSLIPARLQDLVKIDRVEPSERTLLMTKRVACSEYAIAIDWQRWRYLSVDLRNLLFWHELARIENGTIVSLRSTYITLLSGLGLSLIDLPTQNIGILVASLSIAGLAGFRLYQQRFGEEYLRQLTTADRDAIELAVEFGYERSTARELLKSALSQTQVDRDRSIRYAARLQVLSLVDNVTN
jgi:Protein of unknown function (DUF3318)